MTANPDQLGPWIQVACFCQDALVDIQGFTSLVRVLDSVTVRANDVDASLEEMNVTVPLKLVIMVKSGGKRGSGTILLQPVLPDGSTLPNQSQAVRLQGGAHGENITFDVSFYVEQAGLHWFNVVFEDRLLTRIPLDVIFQTGDAEEEGDEPDLNAGNQTE